jgi:hypothetical protein
MADLQGKTLGRYELRQVIGRGGMADVYVWHHRSPGYLVYW